MPPSALVFMPRSCRHSAFWTVLARLRISAAIASATHSLLPSCRSGCVSGAQPDRNPMPDIEIHVDLHGQLRRVGLARCNRVRGSETILFEYADEWLANPDRFSIEPALALTRGVFPPPVGQSVFGAIGDSAPDTWGRRLMQRFERRQAQREARAVRTLTESDYLLGVSDETRLGALR